MSVASLASLLKATVDSTNNSLACESGGTVWLIPHNIKHLLRRDIYEKWQRTEICAPPPQIKINIFSFFLSTKLKRLLFLLNLKWTVQKKFSGGFSVFFFLLVFHTSSSPSTDYIPFTSATSLPVEPHTKGQTVNNKMPEIFFFLTTINNFPGASFDHSDPCADKSGQQLT